MQFASVQRKRVLFAFHSISSDSVGNAEVGTISRLAPLFANPTMNRSSKRSVSKQVRGNQCHYRSMMEL